VRAIPANTRVILAASEEEGWPEERGTCLGDSGPTTVIVELDREYWSDDPREDGLREVTYDQITIEEDNA
jgi:hypothetical protein